MSPLQAPATPERAPLFRGRLAVAYARSRPSERRGPRVLPVTHSIGRAGEVLMAGLDAGQKDHLDAAVTAARAGDPRVMLERLVAAGLLDALRNHVAATFQRLTDDAVDDVVAQ